MVPELVCGGGGVLVLGDWGLEGGGGRVGAEGGDIVCGAPHAQTALGGHAGACREHPSHLANENNTK